MWTRGSIRRGFAVEVFDATGCMVANREGFASAAEADRWGEAEQRKLVQPTFTVSAADMLLTDDELLAALT